MTAPIFDRAEIMRGLSILYPPEHGIIELVTIKKDGYLLSSRFNDREKIVDEIAKHDGREDIAAIYTTLNRLDQDTFQRDDHVLSMDKPLASGPRVDSGNVARVTGILFDIDPFRANGDKKDSTTDSEHQAAIQAADFLKHKLSFMGWPEPVVGSSGNGAALRYLCDLPASDETKDLLSCALKAANGMLPEEFAAQVEVDPVVFDLPRISKVFGTMTRKGPGTIERPHRRAAIIFAPERLEPVKLDCIIKLASLGTGERNDHGDAHHEPHRAQEETAKPFSSDAAERLQALFTADPGFKSRLFTPVSEGGDRSKAEFHLCARLWEAGFSEGEICHIMSHSPQTKWRERDDKYRWDTIKEGIAKAEENHNARVDEEAKKEAAKKAAPIELEEVADITYDEDGEIEKVRFSPTYAARAVLEKMPLAMSADSEDIYHFTGQIYKPEGARIIDRALCEAAGDLNTSDKLKETLRRIKNELLSKPVAFEPNPYLLGVNNCVADLITGEVREYRPEDLLIEQIDVTHAPDARCPAFLAFLESITPNVSDRITLIDWFAATAIKEPFCYVLFLLGLGRNGKGIYEKLIKKFFGKTAFRDMPLAEVAKNNFAAGGFYRKRGWIASETGKRKASIGTDFIKLTSGNGSIDGDRKNQSRIQFEPYFQTVVDTNTMPKIEDSSIGWQERFVKVDLPYIFVANPDKANPLERQRDPALYEKLSTPSELSGILNLLLFRSKAIGKSGQIHKRAGPEMFAEYSQQSSSVATFLDMFCEFVDDGLEFWTPSGPVYEAYCTWCGFKVGEVVEKAYFGRQLKKFCGGYAPKQPKDKDRKTITAYRGLKFDKTRYDSAIETLQKSMSKVCPKMSEVCPRNEEEENSQQVTMSEVSEANTWNEIMKRFGNPTKEDNSPEKAGYEKIPRTLRTPRTSAPLELMGENPSLDRSRTLPRTETIEEQTKAREEHFRGVAEKHAKKKPPMTCAKCGQDLTGHGTVERGGRFYCAVVGCGYPARGDAKA